MTAILFGHLSNSRRLSRVTNLDFHWMKARRWQRTSTLSRQKIQADLTRLDENLQKTLYSRLLFYHHIMVTAKFLIFLEEHAFPSKTKTINPRERSERTWSQYWKSMTREKCGSSNEWIFKRRTLTFWNSVERRNPLEFINRSEDLSSQFLWNRNLKEIRPFNRSIVQFKQRFS